MTTADAAPTPEALRTQLRATGRGIVLVTTSGDDDLAHRVRPRQLTDLPAGRVAVLARPAERRASWLLWDVLAALGATDAATNNYGEQTDADLVRAWLLAYNITDLLIVSAEHLTADQITTTAVLTAGTGTTLWLLATGVLDDARHEAVQGWGAEPITWTQLSAAFADTPTAFGPTAPTAAAPAAADVPVPGDDFPRHLPGDDFPTFRTACRRTLTPDAFDQVDTQLHEDVQAGLTLCEAVHGALTEENVAAHLHSRYRQLPTDAQLLVATHATQIAAFRHGWYLQVNTPGLLATAADSPRPATRTPPMWARLAVYAAPFRGATCALAAADLDTTDLQALTIGDVAADGSTSTTATGTHDLEAGAQLYVRAQCWLRRAHGATMSDPFITAPDGRTLTGRTFADTVSRARTDTGLAVTSRRVARERLVADRWTTRWGISLQPLTTALASR
jgi:hypothetical protein